MRLCFAKVTDFTGVFGVLPNVIWSNSISALLTAMQAFVVSKGMALGCHSIRMIWYLLIGVFSNAASAASQLWLTHGNDIASAFSGTGRLSVHKLANALWDMMSKWYKKKAGSDNIQEPLEEWELLEFEEAKLDDHTDTSSERAAELMGQISQLIDDCEGLESTDWDHLITMLQEGHKAYRALVVEADMVEAVILTDATEDVEEEWELLD